MLVSHHVNFWYLIYCSQGEGPASQTWTKSSVDRGRSTLPRRRTGFNAGALIPGSVSTIVSLPESDDDQTVPTLASPSFQSILDGDTSSEYETDLEEDFPGTVEPRLSGPRSGLFNYPDFFSGPNFFMMLIGCDCRKQPNNPFKRRLKQRIIPYAFQNSQVRWDKELFRYMYIQLIYDWLNCFVANMSTK